MLTIENSVYLVKVKAYKQIVPISWPTLYIICINQLPVSGSKQCVGTTKKSMHSWVNIINGHFLHKTVQMPYLKKAKEEKSLAQFISYSFTDWPALTLRDVNPTVLNVYRQMWMKIIKKYTDIVHISPQLTRVLGVVASSHSKGRWT